MNKVLKTLHCTLAPGGFTNERVFRVKLSTGSEHVGAISSIHCWTKTGDVRGPSIAAEQSIEGRIAARVLLKSSDTVHVSVPDGEVIEVPADQLTEYPEEPDDVLL